MDALQLEGCWKPQVPYQRLTSETFLTSSTGESEADASSYDAKLPSNTIMRDDHEQYQ